MGELSATQASRRRAVTVLAVMAGCLVVVLSSFATWVAVLGSELTGVRMAELIGDFGDEIDSVPPRWVGAAWYLFPAAAGLAWVLAVARAPIAARAAHVVIGAGITLAAGLYLVLQDTHAGPVLAFVGGLLVLGGGLGRSGRGVNSRNSMSMGNRRAGSDI